MTRSTAGSRLRRLLAMIPWIAGRDGPTVGEICARFDLTRAQLLADLEVVFLVGLHPFTPDELIDVTVEDDRVWLRLSGDAFSRPLRLAPEEALALVASGASLLAAPGSDTSGPLARGLAKLGGLLGLVEGEAVSVQLGRVAEATLGQLRSAVAERRTVRLDYYTYGRDERTTRQVDPFQVFSEAGAWYLSGYCHRAGAERLFRVDRIEAVETTEDTFEPPDSTAPTATYHPRPSDPRVTLELAPSAAWVVEQYATESSERLEEGTVRAVLPISAVAWLERLLVRLGPAARVISADEPLSAGLGAAAAARILARYAGGDARAG